MSSRTRGELAVARAIAHRQNWVDDGTLHSPLDGEGAPVFAMHSAGVAIGYAVCLVERMQRAAMLWWQG